MELTTVESRQKLSTQHPSRRDFANPKFCSSNKWCPTGVQCPQSPVSYQPNVLHRSCIWKCPRRLQGRQQLSLSYSLQVDHFHFLSPATWCCPPTCWRATSSSPRSSWSARRRNHSTWSCTEAVGPVRPRFGRRYEDKRSYLGKSNYFSFQVSNGVVKMNVDTDTQWAYWDGLRGFYKKNEGYLQGQVCHYANHSLPENTLYSLTYV